MRTLFVAFTASLLSVTAMPAAKGDVKDFAFEISCHAVDSNPTIMIHAVINYDAASDSCTATNGFHHKYQESYAIPFACEKPVAVTKFGARTLQAFVLRASGQEMADKISFLTFIYDHSSQSGSGFAASENGISHQVICTRWQT